jgi:hypothetical protein
MATTSDREFILGVVPGLKYGEHDAKQPRASLWVRSGFAGVLQRFLATFRNEYSLASCSPESVKELLALIPKLWNRDSLGFPDAGLF